MKKLGIALLSVGLLLGLLWRPCYAETQGMSWYCVHAKGHVQPRVDASFAFVEELDGYYIDHKHESQDDTDKVIYLTFDAGYENGNIEKILDVMRDECVCGAFFILSNLVIKNPELVKRMADEGHLVCNHTSNHKDMTKLTDQEVLANLSRLESQYNKATGYELEKIFRFPEGRYSIRTMKLLCENGYKTVFWSMAYDDWDNSRQMDTECAKEKLISTTHNGAVILLHPTSSTNATILRDLIHTWRDMGYTFGSLKDL